MAVEAIHLQLAGVDLVAERDRLLGATLAAQGNLKRLREGDSSARKRGNHEKWNEESSHRSKAGGTLSGSSKVCQPLGVSVAYRPSAGRTTLSV